MFIQGKLKELNVCYENDTISVTLKLKDYVDDIENISNLLDENVTIDVDKPFSEMDEFELSGIDISDDSKEDIKELCAAYGMPIQYFINFMQYLEMRNLFERFV